MRIPDFSAARGTPLAAVAISLLIGLIGCSAAVATGAVQSLSPSCACATMTSHETGWTPSAPPPLPISTAESKTAKFSGVPMKVDGEWFDLGDRVVIRTTGNGATAMVDGNSGEVIVAVRTDLLPDTGEPVATAAQSESTAAAYLRSVSLTPDGLTAQTRLLPAGLGSAFEVTFTGASDPAPRYRLFVNAMSGKVFAFEIGTFTEAGVPVVGRVEAIRRAQAAIPEHGQLVLSADLQFDTWSITPTWTWQIGLGVPTATQADVFQGGGYVTVDAASGETTVVKR
jgi:hypothetical protein